MKDKIFAAARELFFEHGIRDVCVDVIVSEAGTNKMSFYRNYASKDALVTEFLREQACQYWAWWDAAIAPHAGNVRKQLQALMEASTVECCSKNTAGCALAHAMVELRDETHPGYAVARVFKAEMRARLRDLAREAQAQDPDKLGDALQLVLVGGYQLRTAFSDRESPIGRTADVAAILLESYCGARARSSRADV